MNSNTPNIAIINVTRETIGQCAGYNTQRTDKTADALFFSASDFEVLMQELYYGCDLVVTAIPELIARLNIARFPWAEA